MIDHWAAWLLRHRFGGDPTARDKILPQLQEFRDKVLDGAAINPGDVVLDVGCGQFVQCGLPELEPIADRSVDVASTRSVLIYVRDKETAFENLYRVLHPEGRLPIFEPINRFSWPEPKGVLWGCDVTGLEPLARKVRETFARYAPDPNPMTDFDERDLIRLAEAAGFGEVRLEYRARIGRAEENPGWPTFLKVAPNPLVPTFGEVLTEALDPEEYETLTTRLEEQLPTRQSRPGRRLSDRDPLTRALARRILSMHTPYLCR